MYSLQIKTIQTLDKAQNDVYGVANYILAQTLKNSENIQHFRIRMETEKYGNVAVARSATFDFFKNSEVIGSAKIDRFGNSVFIYNNTESPLLSGKLDENFEFLFSKHGNLLTISTSFGVTLTMNGYDVRLTIPNPVYADLIEGLCGDNDGDKTNDYQTRDGTILPYTPLAGYSRSGWHGIATFFDFETCLLSQISNVRNFLFFNVRDFLISQQSMTSQAFF